MSGELVEQSGIGALVCLRPWTDHPIRIDLDKALTQFCTGRTNRRAAGAS
jgi:hypothetical protein